MAVNSAILKVGRHLAWMALALMVFVILLQVVARYIFNSALPWPDEAARFLYLMSGRRHKVITALAVKKGEQIWQRDVVTDVKMKRLSNEEVAEYVASDEWRGKAGGYTIQGRAGALIPWIQGSYSAVMGLPIAETYALLKAAGLPVSLNTA